MSPTSEAERSENGGGSTALRQTLPQELHRKAWEEFQTEPLALRGCRYYKASICASHAALGRGRAAYIAEEATYAPPAGQAINTLSSSGLFHGYAFCQVAGFIHVASAKHSTVVRK